VLRTLDQDRISGNWSAVSSAEGTVYVSGSVTLTGLVKFGRPTELTITQGAVVSALDVTSFPEDPNVTGGGMFAVIVGSGGLLASAHLDRSSVSILSGGRSEGNSLEATQVLVYSGGFSSGDVLSDVDGIRSTMHVRSGGLAKDLLLDARSDALMDIGAALDGASVGSGCTLQIQPEVQTNNLALAPGATLWSDSPFGGEITIPDRPELPSIFDLSDALVWSAVIDEAGRTYFSDGERAIWSEPPTIEAGASLVVTRGAVISGLVGESLMITVEDGGILCDSYLSKGFVQIQSGGASLNTIYAGAALDVGTLGRSTNDVFMGSDADGRVFLTVMSGGVADHPVIVCSGSLIAQPGGVVIAPKSGEDSFVSIEELGEEACFLAGCLLLTSHGERAVETLAPGDSLVCLDKGGRILRTIERVVRRHVLIRAAVEDDLAGYPVRIRRGAFSAGVPHKDLLVTAEHCFLFGGRFVPVRMLVNGASIDYDRSFKRYHYYHVELERHSVILANGAETESYLAPAERPGISGLRLLKASEGCQNHRELAAPLETSVAFVQPLHQALSARAASGNCYAPRPEIATTSDPGLTLRDHCGNALEVLERVDNRVTFLVPPGATRLWLCSRRFRPCDAVGPYVDDRRELGLLVGEICHHGSALDHVCNAHLTPVSIEGWHGFETETGRWTTGRALIELKPLGGERVTSLTIEILQTGRYRADVDQVPDMAA